MIPIFFVSEMILFSLIMGAIYTGGGDGWAIGLFIAMVLRYLLVRKAYTEEDDACNRAVDRAKYEAKELKEFFEEEEEKKEQELEELSSQKAYLDSKVQKLERINERLMTIKPKTREDAENYVLAYLEKQNSYPITIRRERPINLPKEVASAWDIAEGKKKSKKKKYTKE